MIHNFRNRVRTYPMWAWAWRRREISSSVAWRAVGRREVEGAICRGERREVGELEILMRWNRLLANNTTSCLARATSILLYPS